MLNRSGVTAEVILHFNNLKRLVDLDIDCGGVKRNATHFFDRCQQEYTDEVDRALEKIPEGGIISLNRFDRTWFEEKVLKRLRRPVVIIDQVDYDQPFTGMRQSDTDATLRPTDIIGDARIPCPEPNHTWYLDLPNAVAYITTNPSMIHPKVLGYWEGPPKQGTRVEILKGNRFSDAKRFQSTTGRDNLLFCDGLAPLVDDGWRTAYRSATVKTVAANGFECSTERRNTSAWFAHAQVSKFVLAPRGAGRATMRMNEALMAGAVPVLEKDKVMEHAMWQGVPKVLVSDWKQVTPQFLESEWVRIRKEAASGAYDDGMAKIYWPYWFDHFTQFLKPV